MAIVDKELFTIGEAARQLGVTAQELKNGGEQEIRTLETLSRLHAFQACSFDHSDNPP